MGGVTETILSLLPREFVNTPLPMNMTETTLVSENNDGVGRAGTMKASRKQADLAYVNSIGIPVD